MAIALCDKLYKMSGFDDLSPEVTLAPRLLLDSLVTPTDYCRPLVKVDMSMAEQVRVVEDALNKVFATDCEDVGFDELCAMVDMPRAAVEAALVVMEASNKVMHREARIHLI